MAEVIGIVSGIVQFIDVTVRLSSGLNRLCSDVRHVPERFHQLRIDLDRQLEIAQEVQAHYLPGLVPIVASSTFDQSLLEYVVLAEELRKTLEELLVSNTNGPVKRTWHRLRSVRRKEDILHLCDRLEQKKSTLSLWLGAANLRLSSNLATTTDRTQKKVEETLAHVTPVEESLNRHIAITEHFIPRFQETSHDIADSLAKLEEVIRGVQQIKDQSAMLVEQASTNFSKLDRIDEVSAQASSDTIQMLESLQRLCSGFSQGGNSTRIGHYGAETTLADFHELPFELENTVQSHTNNESIRHMANLGLQSLETSDSTNSGLTNPSIEDRNSSLSLPSARDLDSQQQQSYIALTKSYNRKIQSKIITEDSSQTVCRCRVINKTFHRQLLPFLRFKQILQTQHFSYCLKYVNSDKTTELMIQLVLPSWLLSRSVHFGLQLKYLWSKGIYSISPMVIGTSRFVDSDLSPAFLAIRNAREKLLGVGWHGADIYITNLKNALEDLFDNGAASPFDTDRDGNNLLYEVLRIYKRHLVWGVPGYEYILLIKFLLDKGSDPNVISCPRNLKVNIGGTAFDLFAKDLFVPRGLGQESKDTDPIAMMILESLVAAGSEFSKPLTKANTHSHYICSEFIRQVRQYELFQEQIELCDLGGLVATILQRNESNFQRAVTKAKASDIDHISSINGLAPIHFAVTWPKALKKLIAKGANINVQDEHCRRPIQLAVALGLTASVECLIGADCALYTPPSHKSLLQNALILKGLERGRILNALIAALSNRHQRLIDKARSCLSSSIFSEFGIIEGQKKEVNAPWIRQELLSRGYTIPEALELDNKSVYDVADAYKRLQMTLDVADGLWSAGFRDIDRFDHNGLTPILQNWVCAFFPMIAWFVNKNVSISSRHRDASLNGLHLYAAQFGFSRSEDLEQIPTDERCMAQIQREVGIPHDECTCPCSSHGCSPVGFLHVPNYYGYSPKKNFRIWLVKVRPELRLSQLYVLEFTRRLLFDYLGGRHTCCTLGTDCQIGTKYSDDARSRNRASVIEIDGLPIPRDFITSTEDAERVKDNLDFYMSKYDEMPRRDTIPLAEQPFHYLHWIVKRYETGEVFEEEEKEPEDTEEESEGTEEEFEEAKEEFEET